MILYPYEGGKKPDANRVEIVKMSTFATIYSFHRFRVMSAFSSKKTYKVNFMLFFLYSDFCIYTQLKS